MKYEIIKKSWSKRRKLDQEPTIIDIQFDDFVKEHNHFCKIIASYSNDEKETLIARVIYNEIKQHWIVDGMNVAVRLID